MEKPRTSTPLTEAALAQQIIGAYAAHFGQAPDRETAELLLALIDIENAHGASIIDHNWGNVSTFVKDSIDYWRPPWFDLDAVNALPDGPNKQHLLFEHGEMVANRAPSAFLALPDHETGARVFLSNVKPSMYEAASSGDPMAFAHAYWSSGYCPDEACKNSGPTFAKLQAAIRAAGYFATLAPAKKKVMTPGLQALPDPQTPPEAEPAAPSSPSPASASPSGSSGPLSGSSVANARNLIVFAASCALENMDLLVEKDDQAAIREYIAALWDDVLVHPSPRNAHGLRALTYPPQWCGAFALRCLHEAHVALSVKWEFGPPHYGFLYRLPTTHAPEPGDIAYLDKPWQHHAIVTGVDGDTVHTIDGNQGPSAPIKTHSVPLEHWTAFYSIAPFLKEAIA